MEDQSRVEKLLEEILDVQRQHLEQYKNVTKRSLELQQTAVARQEQIGNIYRIALVVSAVVVAGIIGLVFYLLQYLPMRYR